MLSTLQHFLRKNLVRASAPCRIDFGGTLDIRTFHYPLRHLAPCTVNLALDLRTSVTLEPYHEGRVCILSRGFEPAEFELGEAPFDHPLGLMFAVATYFQAQGVLVRIESASPPRSALGGSSAAAVALTAALDRAARGGLKGLAGRQIALLAHTIEETVAGVPCGLQDQLAAVYGGVHAWYWPGSPEEPAFRRKRLAGRGRHGEIEDHLLVAYCGIPHESRNINGQWVSQFLQGRHRAEWGEIVAWTKKFIDSIQDRNYKDAALAMRSETAIRRSMTPDVLDDLGRKLVDSAARNDCGARFAGAGGGGCIWAMGTREQMQRLRPVWQEILAERETGELLQTGIDPLGLSVMITDRVA